MKLSKPFFAVMLLLALLCVSSEEIAAKDEWRKIQTKNFQLAGNASEKDIRQVAVKLEQFREVFRQTFTKINLNSPVPIYVVVFKDKISFRDFKPVGDDGNPRDWVAGYFQSGQDANYIALSVDGEKVGDYSTIFHEYVHFLINNDFGRSNIPPWFNEGLAEYYETFQIEASQNVSFGKVNENNLRLLNQNRLIPFETFFNTDYYTLYRQGKDGAGLFYAQAWALMHYLTQGNGGTRSAELNRFIDLVLKGKTPKQAFGDAFQTDYATMERELKKYVEQKNYQTSNVILRDKLVFENEMSSSTMSDAEAKAVLGDLLYHTSRLTEAAALLAEALKLDKNSSLANASLGLIKMRQEDFAEAEKYLKTAVALDNKNYMAYFQYAYVLSREEMTAFGFASGYTTRQAEEMRESLRKAIRLNPNFAESYDLYAFISIVRNEKLDEAFAYLTKAQQLAPGNQWYQLRAAELYSRQEDFASARKFAQKVYETAPDDEMRVYAKTTLANINSYEAQLEDVKNARRRSGSDVTDQPLTEEEMARLNEKAMIESINYNLRRPKSGEKRVLGFLTKIECAAEQVVYSLRVDNQNLQLRSENFDSLFLMSYDRDMSDQQVGCGALKKENFAVIIYRPFENSKAQAAGEIASIEFVPKNFKFLK